MRTPPRLSVPPEPNCHLAFIKSNPGSHPDGVEVQIIYIKYSACMRRKFRSSAAGTSERAFLD